MPPTRKRARKILVASLGVAAVSYVGCAEARPVGNLMPSPPNDTAAADAAPPPAAHEQAVQQPVGNLAPPQPLPPPPDAGAARDAGKH